MVITFLSYKYFKTGPKLFWAKHLRVYAERDSSGSADCVFTASAVLMHSEHIFQFPSVRDSADCVSSGRLWEVKDN